MLPQKGFAPMCDGYHVQNIITLLIVYYAWSRNIFIYQAAIYSNSSLRMVVVTFYYIIYIVTSSAVHTTGFARV